MKTLRRALGWIAEAALFAIFVVAMLFFWPFERRTELELKDESDDN